MNHTANMEHDTLIEEQITVRPFVPRMCRQHDLLDVLMGEPCHRCGRKSFFATYVEDIDDNE